MTYDMTDDLTVVLGPEASLADFLVITEGRLPTFDV